MKVCKQRDFFLLQMTLHGQIKNRQNELARPKAGTAVFRQKKIANVGFVVALRRKPAGRLLEPYLLRKHKKMQQATLVVYEPLR